MTSHAGPLNTGRINLCQSATPTANLLAPFDPRSVEQVRHLIRMHQAYRIEELDRTGRCPLGAAVADRFDTFLVQHDGKTAGFCSVDLRLAAIELIYIAPTHRRQGLARRVFTELANTYPQPLRGKGPVTPAMRPLLDDIGLEVPWNKGTEARQARQLDELERAFRRLCPHKQASPNGPCPSCYRKGATATSEGDTLLYVAEQAGPAVARTMQQTMRRKSAAQRKGKP